MNGSTPLVAVVSTGVFAAALVWAILRPPRALAPRVRPYTAVTRAELRRSVDALGQAAPGPVFGEGTLRRLFGPIVDSIVSRLGRLVTTASDEQLAVRLRQAGLYPATPKAQRPHEYRVRSVGRALLLAVLVGLFGLLVFRTPFAVIGFGGLGFLLGLLFSRSAVDQAIADRRERIRGELYTVNQLIAMRTRVGGGAIEATRHVVERANGVVVDELAEALRLHERGWSFTDALYRAADLTPEREAARTYAVIAASHERGADLADALLDLAKDLRASRRDELQAQAAKRRLIMVIPIVVILAPVLLWFLGAPLPSIIFGGL
jgi:Flp pilus assembly protein TadB